MPSSLLCADDPKPIDKDGYQMIPVGTGPNKGYVRVKKQADPFRNVKSSSDSSDKYEPDRINFGSTSSYANKSFSSGDATVSKDPKGTSDLKQQSFITPSFNANSLASKNEVPNTGTKFSTRKSGSSNEAASEYARPFVTTSADSSLNKASLFASNTSGYQGRNARIGSEKTDTFSNLAYSGKQYLGPGAQKVPEDITIKDNVVLTRMSGLPDRTLSIDEVRNLINHETKPNTSAAPEAPSKPLNDPGYKPAPLREAPPVQPIPDDKLDLIPSPGMISSPVPPENLEPLPK